MSEVICTHVVYFITKASCPCKLVQYIYQLVGHALCEHNLSCIIYVYMHVQSQQHHTLFFNWVRLMTVIAAWLLLHL